MATVRRSRVMVMVPKKSAGGIVTALRTLTGLKGNRPTFFKLIS
jgi:hypothetical protein